MGHFAPIKIPRGGGGGDCVHTRQHWSNAFDDILTPKVLNIHTETVTGTGGILSAVVKDINPSIKPSQQPPDERQGEHPGQVPSSSQGECTEPTITHTHIIT